MPKKSTAPVIEEDQDALDDETFAELAAGEERLHVALENPQSKMTWSERPEVSVPPPTIPPVAPPRDTTGM